MPGYPDWQRVETRVQDPLVFNTAFPITTQPTLGPFYVANLERVLFSIILHGSGTYDVSIVWCNDAAGLQAISQLDIVVDIGSTAWLQSLAVQAKYVKVIFTTLVAHAGDTATVSIVPNSNPVGTTEANGTLLITFNAQSIGGGLSDTFESIVTQAGPAVLHVFTAAASWTVDLQYTDLGGLWQTAYHWTEAAANLSLDKQVVLPPQPVRLSIHNGDAAARTFTFTLGIASF